MSDSLTLTAGEVATVRDALADAAAWRSADSPALGCADCAANGSCPDHAADVRRAQRYEALTRRLVAGERVAP